MMIQIQNKDPYKRTVNKAKFHLFQHFLNFKAKPIMTNRRTIGGKEVQKFL